MSSHSEDSSDWDDDFGNSSSEFFDSETDSDDGYFTKHKYESFEWKKSQEPTDCEPPIFTADAGIKANIKGNCDAVDLFELFFDEELTNLIVTNTNLKASMKLTVSDKEKFGWTDATPQEIKALVSLMLHDTIGPLELVTSRVHVLRMFLILRCIAFCAPVQSTSTLVKSKPLIDFTRKKFKEVLIPEQKILIEDRMTLGQDRSSLTKNCYSIETYVLCETSSNYIWNFLLRLSHPRDENKFPEKFKDNILIPLMKDLFGKGYCLYAMNYYNTMEIGMFMREQQSGYVSTLMKYVRNIPKELLDAPIEQGQSEHLYEKSGNFVLMKWGAKRRCPILMSTCHKAEETVIVNDKGKEKVVPKLVVDYETADKNIIFEHETLASFPFETNFKIDIMKMFRHIVNMMVSNAHAIHRKQGGTMSQRKFRECIANGLHAKYVTDAVR